uniref:BPTI/Kunitz inhibitor domain-containing protein n=1 Tax=Setaria digitata TaxID=48799 RepID=A0A915PLT9_9BILA
MRNSENPAYICSNFPDFSLLPIIRISLVESNICSGAEELRLDDRRFVHCNNASCPESYYCHIGNDVRSTVCCRRLGNLCSQQLLSGTGGAHLVRWYYDIAKDRCLKFYYSGLGGNENNFLSKTECEKTCPGLKYYCAKGTPLITAGKIMYCDTHTACPEGYICHKPSHIASSPVCCPNLGVLWLLPIEPNTEAMTLRLGSYPMTMLSQKLRPFGNGENLNHFLKPCDNIC